MRDKPSANVVAALFVKEGKMLVGKRPEGKARAGLWEFVGGKTEKGETDQAALIRECKEELGVNIKVGEEYFRTSFGYTDIKITLALYRAEIENGEPTNIEHAELKWMSPEETEGYEFCPADEPILRYIKEKGL